MGLMRMCWAIVLYCFSFFSKLPKGLGLLKQFQIQYDEVFSFGGSVVSKIMGT